MGSLRGCSVVVVVCLVLLVSSRFIPANCKNLEGFDEADEDEFVEEQVPVESVGWKQQQQPGSAATAGKSTQVTEENDELQEEAKFSNNQEVSAETQSRSSDPVKEKEVQQSSAGEEWDEDEFEGLPGTPAAADFSSSAGNQAKSSANQQQQRQGSQAGGSAPAAGKSKAPPAAPVRRKLKPLQPQDLIVEGILVLFLAVFGINFFVGRQTNESLALAWAEQFASSGSILHKNFALLGTGTAIKNTTKDTPAGGDEAEGSSSSEGKKVGGSDDGALLIKDGQNFFKLYASGRRYCESLLVQLQLRNRHDLITLLWETVMGNKDHLEAEVVMDDDAMPPMVFAIMRKQAVKAFLKDNGDCRDFASVIDTSALRSKWGASDLAVISESRELANELLSDVIVEQLFSEKAQSLPGAPLLESIHFSDRMISGGRVCKALRFCFTLPAARNMADLTRLVTAIPYFIDAVGRLTLSAAARAKAEEKRAAALEASLREKRDERQEELQRRKDDKRRAEEAKMSPEELSRRRAKERQKALRSAGGRVKA